MKTLLIVSDVLISEQVNGVSTWLVNTKKELEKQGLQVIIFDASYFSHTFPVPKYHEVHLVLSRRRKVEKILHTLGADYIHIATEGTLGYLVRSICIKNKWKFTTSYHTSFPEYFYVRTKSLFVQKSVYRYMRNFHKKAAATVVSTESLKNKLVSKDFTHLRVVPLGVDIQSFRRNPQAATLSQLQKPIFVYFGRIAPEKNIEAFLQCELPGSKLVIGDGPSKSKLEKKYTQNTVFVGYKKGQALVDLLSQSDVCVFPSKTDTFGLTIIEALSCGLPVAAYDVQGPNTILTSGENGYLGDNLEENAKKCLSLNKEKCVQSAEKYSWENSAKKFLEILVLK